MNNTVRPSDDIFVATSRECGPRYGRLPHAEGTGAPWRRAGKTGKQLRLYLHGSVILLWCYQQATMLPYQVMMLRC